MEMLSEYLNAETIAVFCFLLGVAIATVGARYRWQISGAVVFYFACVVILDAVILSKLSPGLSRWFLLFPVATLGIAVSPAWMVKSTRYALLWSVVSSLVSTACVPFLLWRLMCAGDAVCY
jgi:hypothetical protein